MKYPNTNIPASIEFYQEGDLNGLDLKKLGLYVFDKTLIPFYIRHNIYRGISRYKVETLAREFAMIKVKDPNKKFTQGNPLKAEIDYEKRRILTQGWKVFGILYEGVLYQRIICQYIFKGKLESEKCVILFTNQLFGTWSQDDQRYHARTSLYGFPHLISTSGVVEAPAKPKEFYIKRQMGIPLEFLKEEYRGRFIDHGDLRMTEIMKGYVMQALFYHLLGNPFCEDRDCRLFNSHWQEEMIHSQLDGKYEFCPEHDSILKNVRNRKL
jgi:hypothetical protein